MPTGLTGTYERIWTRINGGTSHPTQRRWALRTLKLILFAKRPLSPEEIIEATALDPADTTFAVGRMVSSINYLIDVCGNFVALDLHTSRVRFVHYSVQEFLASKREFQSSELMITEACFITLGQGHGGGGAGCKFYAYATRYWAEHSRCLNEIDHQLATLIQRFLLNQQCFEDWRTERQGLFYYPDTAYHALVYFNLPVLLECLQQHTSHHDDRFALAQSESLVLSANWGYSALVKLLLEAGADVNFCSSKGVSSLQAAVRKGSEMIVNQLLAAGADPNCQDSKGDSCLHAAVISGSVNIVKSLLAARADTNFPNSQGRSTLQSAARRGSKGIVEHLLTAGADVNFRDKNGRSALEDAVLRDSEGIVAMLLDAHADTNFRGGYSVVVSYRSALQQAVSNGSERIVELLVAAGANVNVRDSMNGSLLNEALSYSSDKIIQQLVAAGAVVDTDDQASRVPFEPDSHLNSAKYLQLQEAGVARVSDVPLRDNLEVMDNGQVLNNISSSEHIQSLETVHVSDNIQVSNNGRMLKNVHVMDNAHVWGNN